MNNGITYRAAGVDIEAGDALVERIKPLARATARAGVLGGLGGFGALFDLKAAGFRDPVLVATTDGVGTKLKLAIDTGMHATVGIDLVAMCVNDLVVQGAEPLFFLDYFATGALDVEQAAQVVAGIAAGCSEAGCALVGGETAEMPGMYAAGDYDLAGFSVGAAERDALLPDAVSDGDAVLALPSSGVHSNGYSLVRRVVAASGAAWSDPAPFAASPSAAAPSAAAPSGTAQTLAEALLTPTRIYVRPLLSLHRAGLLRAAAHITGGGLVGNVPRVLPPGLSAALDASRWTLPPVFRWLARAGGIAPEEMLRVFNCGVGMVLVVRGRRRRHRPPGRAGGDGGRDRPHRPRRGRPGRPRRHPARLARLTRIAVLISGRGSNMEALLRAFPEQVALVLSNNPAATGLSHATAQGVEALAIDHRPFRGDRAAHEHAIQAALEARGIGLVCLAGYMRLLTPFLAGAWAGRMLNVHPSLLPAPSRGCIPTNARWPPAWRCTAAPRTWSRTRWMTARSWARPRSPSCPATRRRPWPRGCWRRSTCSTPPRSARSF